ncbi:tetratricopeptide repeat protein [Marinospirillum minutulum]|uniref:tetratricopeptide repeat protein n=1 Tax=Marinospirillum minutulum TaxID=64974 RepID=UPI00041FDE0E|nr:tetratricopeptide repeat protein [Marinospirillum minutulum]
MFQNIRIISFGVLLFILSFSLHAKVEALELLLKEERFSEAYQLGQQLLPEQAGNPNFDMAFGIAALKTGEYDQALFAFERVLMFDSKAPAPRFELARTYFMLGNLNVARRHLNQLLDTTPQLPPAAMKRVQWYLAAIDAREAGKAVATSDGVTRFYLGARLGYESNPSNMTQKDVLLYDRWLLTLPKVESDTFHEVVLGATRYQQQGESWGWFAGADANLRGYHADQSDMGNYGVGIKGGGILLGKSWRLTLPLQVNKQLRKDKNEVLLLALATEFNQRIDAKSDYTVFGQLAAVNFTPGNTRDKKSFTVGLIYSHRVLEQLNLYGGPIFGLDNADTSSGKHFGRNLLGTRTGLGYRLNDQQQIDFNLNYMNAKHKAKDPAFPKTTRKDDLLGLNLKFSHKHSNNWLFDLGLEHTNQSSTLNLYNYRSTQVSAGVRKEW